MATLLAATLTSAPALYFLLLSMVTLCWDVFALLGKLHWLLFLVLLPVVGFGFFALSIAGSIYMPDRPRIIISFWTTFLGISFATLLLRLLIEHKLKPQEV